MKVNNTFESSKLCFKFKLCYLLCNLGQISLLAVIFLIAKIKIFVNVVKKYVNTWCLETFNCYYFIFITAISVAISCFAYIIIIMALYIVLCLMPSIKCFKDVNFLILLYFFWNRLQSWSQSPHLPILWYFSDITFILIK